MIHDGINVLLPFNRKRDKRNKKLWQCPFLFFLFYLAQIKMLSSIVHMFSFIFTKEIFFYIVHSFSSCPKRTRNNFKSHIIHISYCFKNNSNNYLILCFTGCRTFFFLAFGTFTLWLCLECQIKKKIEFLYFFGGLFFFWWKVSLVDLFSVWCS